MRRALQNFVDITRRGAFLEVTDNRVNLIVRNKRTVHAHWDRRSGWQIKHIAMSQQIFCALLIENRPGVHFGRHLKCDARWHVGLDETSDHVDRRTLCGKNEMYAGRACFLRQSHNEFLNFLANNHHHVGELVDDDHDERQRRQHGMLDGFFFVEQVGRRENRILDRIASRYCIANLAVVAADIAHSKRRHQRVTSIHLGHTPTQRIGRFPHVRHDRRQQMWNALINRKLEHFRVDHDQAHMFRMSLV